MATYKIADCTRYIPYPISHNSHAVEPKPVQVCHQGTTTNSSFHPCSPLLHAGGMMHASCGASPPTAAGGCRKHIQPNTFEAPPSTLRMPSPGMPVCSGTCRLFQQQWHQEHMAQSLTAPAGRARLASSSHITTHRTNCLGTSHMRSLLLRSHSTIFLTYTLPTSACVHVCPAGTLLVRCCSG
jgi:hypothetical protein